MINRWPLKLKVGIYSSTLVVLGLIGASALMAPLIYDRQLESLDERLREDAAILFNNLEDVRNAPVNPHLPIRARFVPNWLNQRYLQLEGPDGENLYRSKNLLLRNQSLEHCEPGIHTIELFGKNCRVLTLTEGPITLHVGTRLGTLEAVQQDLRFGLLVSVPIAGLLVFVGGILLARRALEPVSAMTEAAERISARTPDERLPIPAARDELARLTEVLNRSFDRLQRAYTTAARFSADASHQLKTPITVLRAGLDELRLDDQLNDEQRGTVSILLQQTRRLTTLVEDLLLLAQVDAGRLSMEPAPLDLTPILDTLADDLDALGHDRGLTVERETPEKLMAQADARRVKIILQNLGENAAKYSREGGRILLRGWSANGTIHVCIANTGAPIPGEHQDRLFDRFNRAGQGETIRGHGLGLNIARELARAHGGELRLAHSDAESTEFELTLPAA